MGHRMRARYFACTAAGFHALRDRLNEILPTLEPGRRGEIGDESTYLAITTPGHARLGQIFWAMKHWACDLVLPEIESQIALGEVEELTPEEFVEPFTSQV
jgi:hypothetical protein